MGQIVEIIYISIVIFTLYLIANSLFDKFIGLFKKKKKDGKDNILDNKGSV